MRGETEKIFFVTSNPHKFDEARRIFKEFDLDLGHLRVERRELQSEKLEEIAVFSAEETAKKYGLTIFTEDAGLFIDALNGFPGPYSSYVYETIGRRGLLKLLEGISDRRARFVSAVAYSDKGRETRFFLGEAIGRITKEERGEGGFAFDAVFISDEGGGKTFAEMSTDEKNRISHRRVSLEKLICWLTQVK